MSTVLWLMLLTGNYGYGEKAYFATEQQCLSAAAKIERQSSAKFGMGHIKGICVEVSGVVK